MTFNFIIHITEGRFSCYNKRTVPPLHLKKYFEVNPDAVEVLIFKGHKFFSVERTLTLSIQYHKIFRKRYEK